MMVELFKELFNIVSFWEAHTRQTRGANDVSSQVTN